MGIEHRHYSLETPGDKSNLHLRADGCRPFKRTDDAPGKECIGAQSSIVRTTGNGVERNHLRWNRLRRLIKEPANRRVYVADRIFYGCERTHPMGGVRDIGPTDTGEKIFRSA